MRLGGAGVCAAIAILGAAIPSPARADEPAKAASDAKAPAAASDKPASDKPASDDDKPPRPPLPDVPRPPRLPWQEHVEVGGGFAIVATPVSQDGDRNPTAVRVKPGPGFHIRLSWEALPYLWFTGYVIESRHPLGLPPGSLGLPVQLDNGDAAWMYTFGARLSPTLPLGSRVRLWITAGAGWGRIEYPRLCPKQPCDGSFLVRERAASILEIPVGIGAAVEIIPRWLRLHVELMGSVLPNQGGAALEHAQTIDAAGKMRDVLPMPRLDSILTQTIGLSLVL
ncbi:MAG: hypothetical protein QM820_15180 [Minicystis sp.]